MRTSLRHLLLGTGAAGLLLAGGIGAPSAHADSTLTTFDVPAGRVSIDAADSATLSSVTNTVVAGMVVSGSLGGVTVTDTRNVTLGWTATAAAGDFTQQDGPGDAALTGPADTIPGAAATITSPATADSVDGLAVFVPGVLPGNIGGATTTGNNAITFTPSVSIAVPADTAPGTYTGTVTTSVS